MLRISAFSTALLVLLVSCEKKTAPTRDLKYALPYMTFVDLDLRKVLGAPDGTVANLQSLKGKTIVLEFWATWCGPCIVAMPHMKALAEECANDPIQFIAITGEDEKVVSEFLKKNPIAGWVGLDKSSEANPLGSTANRFGILAIPHTVIIDQHGFLIAHMQPSLLTREGLLQMMKARE